MEELARLQREIKGVVFPYPIMLAAGVVKTFEQAKALAATDVIPEIGSFTTMESSGNGGLDYHAEYINVGGRPVLLYTQNSLGLPNPGIAHIEKHGRELVRIYADHGKPIGINVSGTSVDDTIVLIKRALAVGFPLITVNGACPNKFDGKDRPMPIMCFDPESIDMLFERAEKEIGTTNTIITWKVSAGMPHPILMHNITKVATSRVFDGIVTSNTLANTFNYDESGRPTIRTDKFGITRGGMGGPAVLPSSLGQAELAARTLPEGKFDIGVGGVVDVNSAAKYFRAGSVLVQINSGYREANEDPRFITHLLGDLLGVL
ncbi:hypothetical protein HZC00_03635 [Candidatus Kaiserbacteria bacterium]|nr:hypothetical protein [Candidatus Kaiserbacteria bacterium]